MLNNKDIKVVAFDLDGTIVHNHNTISQENIDVINELRSSGIKIVYATGRTYGTAKTIPGLPESDYMVCLNGAWTGLWSGEELQSIYLDKSMVKKLLNTKEIRSLLTYAHHASKICYEIGEAPHLISGHSDIEREEIEKYFLKSAYEDLDENLFQKFVIHNKDIEALEKTKLMLEELYPNEIACVYTAKSYLEVIGADMGKEVGLEYVLNRLGLTFDNLLAMGDNGNDEKMLHRAGVGVLMRNCMPSMMSDKLYMTLKCSENGASRFLKAWFHLLP